MLLQLQGVGKPKIDYKNHKDISFDSLNSYILLAKKSISKFANQFYHGLASKMLKDEDAIANVANSIMMADWRWDENYSNTKGTKKNKYSYRNQCALWAIQTYVTKNNKNYGNKKYNVMSLDHYFGDDDDSTSLKNFAKDSRASSPLEIALKNEQQSELNSLIDNLLSLDCLTSRQKDYIRLYYFESYTFEKIGQKYNITREAVRQGLNKAIDLIKSSINHDND